MVGFSLGGTVHIGVMLVDKLRGVRGTRRDQYYYLDLCREAESLAGSRRS